MQLQLNISLKEYNTFGIEAKASAFAEVNSEAEAAELIKAVADNPLPKWVLGGGSNVLFTENLHALVIKNIIGGIEVENEDADNVIIKAGAGVPWHSLVMFAVERNYGGIENLSLIPGTCGAAPIQNIGAYGVELKDVFLDLQALRMSDAKSFSFTNSDCKFGYRDSIFKNTEAGKYLITSIRLKLSKHPKLNTGYGAITEVLEKNGLIPTVKSVSDAVIGIRQSKLPNPAEIGNAGSFFKNPEIADAQFLKLKSAWPAIPSFPASVGMVKVPAGWLIEQCGWKGKRIGNCGVHINQALVLVNYGMATGAEIKALAYTVSDSVFDKFGIRLNPEVNFIPDSIL